MSQIPVTLFTSLWQPNRLQAFEQSFSMQRLYRRSAMRNDLASEVKFLAGENESGVMPYDVTRMKNMDIAFDVVRLLFTSKVCPASPPVVREPRYDDQGCTL